MPAVQRQQTTSPKKKTILPSNKKPIPAYSIIKRYRAKKGGKQSSVKYDSVFLKEAVQLFSTNETLGKEKILLFENALRKSQKRVIKEEKY